MINLDNTPIFDFSVPSIEDLRNMGISESLYSPYNVIAVYQSKVVGYITIEDRNINLPTKRDITKEESDYVELLKSKKWLLVRRINFNNRYLETGNLLNMFDYLVRILPNDCFLWTNKHWDRKTCYIDSIGGFTELPTNICKNKNILIYSVYQRKNE